jgi:DHA1 family bicyclomycin/chloramphenicol resistance-like MFS transporter
MSFKILPLILIVLSIGSAIELEMLTPSFVDMAKFFKVSAEIIGWTVTANLIGFILGALFIGALSDSYGRKKITIIGNLLLLTGAIGCMLSPVIEILLFSRFVQGIGAATAIVLVPVIIADIYQVAEAEKFYKINNAVLTIFTAGAPVAGGFINDSLGWRANFTFVVIIEFFAWLILVIFFVESKKNEYTKFNIISIYKDFKVVLLNFKFLLAANIPSLIWVIYFIFITYAPFIYIEKFGINAKLYSIHLLVFVGVYSTASFFAIKIKTTKKSLFIGCFTNIVAFMIMFYAKSPYLMTFSMCINSLGAALIVPAIFSYSMGMFPECKGISSSAIVLLRNIFMALGVWIVGIFYAGSVFSIAFPSLIVAIIISLMTFYLIKCSNIFKNEIDVV